jgi:S1-C subfamily serine protease
VKKIIGLLFAITATSAWAQNFVNSHQHQLFELAEVKEEATLVYSRINNKVPGHSANYIIIEAQGKPNLSFTIPTTQYEFEKQVAQSVFVATTGTGTSQGTAFLVGQDLVLTNKHVLANETECRKFAVALNHKKETVSCKKVLHCSKTHDFCLIQMNAMTNAKLLGEEIQPLNFTRAIPKNKDMTFIIGNAYGMGIQAASYKGVVDLKADWGHFNRAFSGNSGSPLVNEFGEVLGIHYGRIGLSSANYGGPDDRMIGTAVKTSTILKEIEKFL